MREDVVTARPDTSAQTLAETMRDENVGSVVIEDDHRRPVGIVTDRDLAVRVLAHGSDPTKILARDVMTEDPVTADVEDGVLEATATMRDNDARRLPIVNGEELVGILTLDDLQRLLVDEQRNLAAVVESESPPY